MKNKVTGISLLKICAITLIVIGSFLPSDVLSQSPPPPPSDHGTSGNQQSGGGAPVGGGLFILLGLAGVYGGVKVYNKVAIEKKDNHI